MHQSLISLLIVIVILAVIVAIIYSAPLPQPFKNIALIIMGAIFLIIIILLLVQVLGMAGI